MFYTWAHPGAEVTNVDGLTVTITLTELQRVQSIAMSNTPGGDSTAVVVDFSAGAVRDVGTNQNAIQLDVPMTETADTILPIVLSGAIDYGTGILLVNASETIDVTEASLVDLQRLFLAQTSTDSRWGVSGPPLTTQTRIWTELTCKRRSAYNPDQSGQ